MESNPGWARGCLENRSLCEEQGGVRFLYSPPEL